MRSAHWLRLVHDLARDNNVSQAMIIMQSRTRPAMGELNDMAQAHVEGYNRWRRSYQPRHFIGETQ